VLAGLLGTSVARLDDDEWVSLRQNGPQDPGDTVGDAEIDLPSQRQGYTDELISDRQDETPRADVEADVENDLPPPRRGDSDRSKAEPTDES